ncbi:hypothetical protein [Paucibacter sp. DJ2R-2]|uniref:hypothetical protein n=1 Tax=Paucibacter sp. DJ2R-2 TaxID=2893558 RepID=UPI0021E3BB6F|nr:hypothetical protein [Paucibacter sp. DJ2R-2]MCV2421199.1 hypothetical protein [Paucibacter sp. DJ4R-1]MCV2439177.1 hypothetical protein [Paucibacter sp. DJ2R-2]
MFNVTFIKNTFDAPSPDSNARFAALRRDDQLPFAPTVGQEFFWATEKAQKVVAVTWNFEESSFTCKVEDEFVDALGIDAFDFDELVENAPCRGWKVVRIFDAK